MLINEEDGFISCHHSSSESGHYYIGTGNVTWKTHCRMKGIPGCGKGVWELVMRLNGSRVCCHQFFAKKSVLNKITFGSTTLDFSTFLISTVLRLRTRSVMTLITGPARPRPKKEQRSRLQLLAQQFYKDMYHHGVYTSLFPERSYTGKLH